MARPTPRRASDGWAHDFGVYRHEIQEVGPVARKDSPRIPPNTVRWIRREALAVTLPPPRAPGLPRETERLPTSISRAPRDPAAAARTELLTKLRIAI